MDITVNPTCLCGEEEATMMELDEEPIQGHQELVQAYKCPKCGRRITLFILINFNKEKT